MDRVGQAATYGGAGGAVYFGFTLNDIGVLAGIIIGLLGLALSWYYKHQHLLVAREALKHKKELPNVESS